jgi:ethanolamine utilization protein EutJ
VVLTGADILIGKLEERMANNIRVKEPGRIKVGVDLGTAYLVVTVLDGDNQPLAGTMTFAQVVRDGIVVDYWGAVEGVRALKEEIEKKTGLHLKQAATAIPPGTGEATHKSHAYVVETAGLEVVQVVDEPTAANRVLGVANGAVVDIGGGTTGVAVFCDGEVVYTADEPTGGTHITLVLSGRYGISFTEAEKLKLDPTRREEVLAAVTPVIEKMGTIVREHLRRAGTPVEAVYLVGGTSCLAGVEDIIARETELPVYKPRNPLLVTPLGIAMCSQV